MAAAVVMAGISAASSISQAKKENEQIDYNAEAQEAQAQETLYAGRSQATNIRSQSDSVTGSVKAAAAGSGVSASSGSVMDVIEQSAFNIEMDALTIESDAARSAENQIATAGNMRKSKTSGLGMMLGAVGSGASGYASGAQLSRS